MALNAADTQIKIDPYTSTVPLVQVPPQEMEAQSRPAGPLPGQFGKKGTGGLAVGDALLKGFLAGHQAKAQQKFQQAQATIAAADKSVADSYSQYQDALATNKDSTATDAAYKNYLDQFNRSKAAKAQFAIPEKPAKGQKGAKKDQAPGTGGIKEFFAANPHIIPQIALMTMQPKPPGASSETTETQNRLKEQTNTLTMQGQAIEANKTTAAENADKTQREQQQRQVEAAGGIDAVLADKKASPELQQMARQMKFSALDAQSPEAKLKMGLLTDIQSGTNKTWTPEQHMLAGALGVVPEPVATKTVGKNGHEMQVLVDPLTNQPIAGSKPLDLGPPQWASEFYAKRAADQADLEKAVRGDPASYGVTLTGNKAQDNAAIDARVATLKVRAEFGIASMADMTGKTGYEIQRNNGWLDDVSKELGSRFPGGVSNADATVQFDWPGGQKLDLTKDQAMGILNEFVTSPTETAGIRTFRDVPQVQGKDAGAAERDRKWAYQFVKNRLMAQKGKNALTSEQADAVLKGTALGTPITAIETGPMPSAPKKKSGFFSGDANWFSPPPAAPGSQGASKLYRVSGYEGAVALSDDEVAKAKAANISVEPVDSLTQ